MSLRLLYLIFVRVCEWLVLLGRPSLARARTEGYSSAPGGIITDRAYLKVFHAARTQALTAQEASLPLLDVPYALRHAAASTWLNAGVAPPQVAEWAGHSVAVLVRIYAKCISGQHDEAMRRIFDATQDDLAEPGTNENARKMAAMVERSAGPMRALPEKDAPSRRMAATTSPM